MTSCGSERSSYNAGDKYSFFSGDKDDGGSADGELSNINNSMLKEMDVALRSASTTGVDPAMATPARKKRSYAGGSIGSSTESLSGKHLLGASLKVPTGSCPRNRLQRHRLHVAGKVLIPEAWCGEARLREWVSSCDVEETLQPPGLSWLVQPLSPAAAPPHHPLPDPPR